MNDNTDKSTDENFTTSDDNERSFSGNVAFLGPGAVVGRWLGKKLGKKFVWDGEAGQGGVEQGVDGGDMEQNVKSEQFVRALRRIRRH